MNKGQQIKPNNTAKAKKDLAQYTGLNDKLPATINRDDVGYYHMCLITARDNKAKTIKKYELNLAKISVRSYEDSNKTISKQFAVVAILHDPTKPAAQEMAKQLRAEKASEKQVKNTGGHEYASHILKMQEQMSAMAKVIEGYTSKDSETKTDKEPKSDK